MVIRIIMVLVLLAALTGCLKKAADENVSVEPAASEETTASSVTGAGQEAQTQAQVSMPAETAASKTISLEKPSVQDIQQALKNANIYQGKIDGVFGPKTKNAIETFQSQKGLKADGKVGPKTWQKLKEYLAVK